MRKESISLSLRNKRVLDNTFQGIFFLKTITNQKEENIIFPFKKQVYSKKIIGVASVASGLGTTHVALTLANYICSKMGIPAAYVELNTTNQINALIKTEGNHVFSYKGIDIFPKASFTSLLEILNSNYQYFILDMGVLSTYTIKEFLRCDKQFLICSSKNWRVPDTMEKIETLFKNKKIQNHVTAIMNLSEKELSFSIFPHMHRCISFPFIENPFQLKPSHFHVISQILERN